MGLTGAGGALVAIPLFMHFQGMSLKEASLFSLIAVVISSLSNFYHQRKSANRSLAISLVISSSAGSVVSYPYKTWLPDKWIIILLTAIALYSLYSIWKPGRKKGTETPFRNPKWITILIGLILGALTTFTGLGGGVLILPVLLSIYHLAEDEAVATSLAVVGLSSLISFSIQAIKANGIPLSWELLNLILGIVVTSSLLKIVNKKLPVRTIEILRKLVFTLVVLLSVFKLFAN